MANVTHDPAPYETAGLPRAAGDIAELGELVAALAAETAVLAETVGRIAGNVDEVDAVMGIMLAARRAGYAEGLAVHDDHLAAARAQQARAGFRLIKGGAR